jgi:hypothetical protein
VIEQNIRVNKKSERTKTLNKNFLWSMWSILCTKKGCKTKGSRSNGVPTFFPQLFGVGGKPQEHCQINQISGMGCTNTTLTHIVKQDKGELNKYDVEAKNI